MHLKLNSGETAHINIDSPCEARLLVDVLRNEKPVYYDTENGLVMTGMEPVSEGEG